MKSKNIFFNKCLLALIILSSCSYSGFGQRKTKSELSEKLDEKTTVIMVIYGAVSCECAQWVLTEGTNKKEYIFLEPASGALVNAEKIWDGEHLPLKLKLLGRFYKRTGFPENYHPIKGAPEPAKVFRYDKIEIISQYFKTRSHWGG